MTTKTPLPPHPVQPLYRDDKGTLRFRHNLIVKFLLENGGIDLNKLSTMPFSQEDRCQFAQLIGYSLSGYGDLPYVGEEEFERALDAKLWPEEENSKVNPRGEI